MEGRVCVCGMSSVMDSHPFQEYSRLSDSGTPATLTRMFEHMIKYCLFLIHGGVFSSLVFFLGQTIERDTQRVSSDSGEIKPGGANTLIMAQAQTFRRS